MIRGVCSQVNKKALDYIPSNTHTHTRTHQRDRGKEKKEEERGWK
jgi:hypothetical protein